jgi:hypothetical protein
MNTIAFQPEFRPALPVVFGAKEYREFRTTIVEIERILTVTDLEHCMIARHIESSNSSKPGQTHYKTLQRALRYSILLGITGNSYRELSQRVADIQIFRIAGSFQLEFGESGEPTGRYMIEEEREIRQNKHQCSRKGNNQPRPLPLEKLYQVK